MNSFTSGNIEKYFELARNSPLNKDCSDGEISLLVFYHLVSDEDLKNNGNQKICARESDDREVSNKSN